MGNCFLLPYILGCYLPIALIKKRIKFSRYKSMVVQKSTIGHLTKNLQI
jgi:hypothetical protein